MRIVLCVVLASVLVGCQNRKAQLVGSWKAQPTNIPKTNNFSDAARAGMYSLFTQGLTVEFSDKDSFKMSVFIGAGTGTYKIDGDTVTMTFGGPAPSQPLKFKFKDEKTLELVTEFASDPKIILVKQ